MDSPAGRVKGLHLDTRWHLSVMSQKRFLLQMGSLARSYVKSCLPLRSNCFPSVCHAGTRACPQFFTVEVAIQILTSLRCTDWTIQYTYYIYMFYTQTQTHRHTDTDTDTDTHIHTHTRARAGLSCWLSRKESAHNPGDVRDCGFSSWVGKIPWRRKWQPTLVFLPGKELGGLQSMGSQELDTI